MRLPARTLSSPATCPTSTSAADYILRRTPSSSSDAVSALVKSFRPFLSAPVRSLTALQRLHGRQGLRLRDFCAQLRCLELQRRAWGVLPAKGVGVQVLRLDERPAPPEGPLSA